MAASEIAGDRPAALVTGVGLRPGPQPPASAASKATGETIVIDGGYSATT
jgi:hypothetical protein